MTELKNMAKQTLSFDLMEVVVENDEIEDSVIDSVIGRFPHLVTNIFKELDDQTLATCRNVSGLFCDHLESDKFYWVRRIQRYKKNVGTTYPQWNNVLKNTSVELVKELAVSTQQFFKDDATRTDLHWSPLQVVAEQGNLELCKYILEKTKNTKSCIQNNVGVYYTHPLLMAAKKGHVEIVKFLLDISKEKNPSDVDGMTPFHFAAKSGRTDVCKLIIENIDNKNPAAPNGCTPLHLAAMEGHLEIVRLIVETGVDKNSLYCGMTPLDCAGPLRSYTFYKLLSEDKAQLHGSIFNSLKHLFAINSFTFSLLFFCIFMIVLMSLSNQEVELFRNNFPVIIGKLLLATFVSFITTVLLTFMISLKIGYKGLTRLKHSL